MWKRILLLIVLALALAIAALSLLEHLHNLDAIVSNRAGGLENIPKADAPLKSVAQKLDYNLKYIGEDAARNPSFWNFLRSENAELTRAYLVAADDFLRAQGEFVDVQMGIDGFLDTMLTASNGTDTTTITSKETSSENEICWRSLARHARICENTSVRVRLLAKAAEDYQAAVSKLAPRLKAQGLSVPDQRAGYARMEALLRGEWVRRRADFLVRHFHAPERGEADLVQVNEDLQKELDRMVESFKKHAAEQGVSLD